MISIGLKSAGRSADGVSNPMRVDTSLLDGITAATSAARASSTSLKSSGATTSFSSALKSAEEKETTKPVAGQAYAEILTGPRAGLFLNTSGNSRDGEAFILVKHDGREDHIYGTGKDRKVVGTGSASGSTKGSPVSTETAPADERTEAVPGRPFADILNGRRSGLFLNTSGNARDGHAFVLVERNGREYHIYGSGKDRRVFAVTPPAATPADTTTTDAPTGTVPTGPLVTDNPG
jgi:hypothetical protein